MVVYSELSGVLAFEYRLCFIVALFSSVASVKLTLMPRVDYFFIVSNFTTDQRQQRIRTAALTNAIVITTLLAFNVAFTWRCFTYCIRSHFLRKGRN